MNTVQSHVSKSAQSSSIVGPEFKLFVLYLTFVYFNPQDIITFIRPLRLPLILAALSLLIGLSRKKIAIFAFSQTKLLFFFVVLSVISTFFSINFDNSMSYMEGWIKSFAFYLLIVLNTDTKDNLTKLIRIIILFMFINAVFTFIAGKVGLMPAKLRMVSYFGFGGSNDFALMLLAHLPFALVFMENEANKNKRLYLASAAIAFLGCLTRTRSRMGFVGAILFIIQVAWAKRRNTKFILLILGICIFVALNTHTSFYKRIKTINKDGEAQHTRIRLWEQATELMAKRPLLGVGPGNFIEAKSYYYIPGNKTHVAHNSFLHVGAETGIPAMILFSLIGIFCLKKLLSLERSLKELDPDLFSLCQATRQCTVVVIFSMAFLSQQHNHFYIIIAGLTASIERLYLEISNEN